MTQKEYLTILEKILTQKEYLTILREFEPKLYYEGNPESFYNKIFTNLQRKKNEETNKVVVQLPEWMSERIREELKVFEEFRCLSFDDIETFLKKELRKNSGEIKDKHIRNKFKNIDDYRNKLKSKYFYKLK